ncbi:hypothetical protein [Flavivirga eckloniae]|nr:hypothetical protein [Flavivirga eckloniae]
MHNVSIYSTINADYHIETANELGVPITQYSDGTTYKMDYKNRGGGLVKRLLDRYLLLKTTYGAILLNFCSDKKYSVWGKTVISVSRRGIKLTAVAI